MLEGSWYYAEKDWVARAGMMVWEPPGDIHTLMCGEEGTVTLFVSSRARCSTSTRRTTWSASTTCSATPKTVPRLLPLARAIEPLDLDY